MIDIQISCCSFEVRFSIQITFREELSTYLNQTFASEELGVNAKGGCWAGILHSHITAAEQYSTVLKVLNNRGSWALASLPSLHWTVIR